MSRSATECLLPTFVHHTPKRGLMIAWEIGNQGESCHSCGRPHEMGEDACREPARENAQVP